MIAAAVVELISNAGTTPPALASYSTTQTDKSSSKRFSGSEGPTEKHPDIPKRLHHLYAEILEPKTKPPELHRKPRTRRPR